jgi:hypothetical protein
MVARVGQLSFAIVVNPALYIAEQRGVPAEVDPGGITAESDISRTGESQEQTAKQVAVLRGVTELAEDRDDGHHVGGGLLDFSRFREIGGILIRRRVSIEVDGRYRTLGGIHSEVVQPDPVQRVRQIPLRFSGNDFDPGSGTPVEVLNRLDFSEEGFEESICVCDRDDSCLSLGDESSCLGTQFTASGPVGAVLNRPGFGRGSVYWISMASAPRVSLSS